MISDDDDNAPLAAEEEEEEEAAEDRWWWPSELAPAPVLLPKKPAPDAPPMPLQVRMQGGTVGGGRVQAG